MQTLSPPSPPRPVAQMTMAEARRMATDADYAARFDPMTRLLAWRTLLAARKGQRLRLVLITDTPTPLWPGDAA